MSLDLNALFSVMVIIVGGICVLLLVSTKTLRDSRDDQEKRITQLEDENKRLAEDLAKKDATLEVVGKGLLGEVHWQAVTDMTEHILKTLNTHHEQAVEQWSKVATLLGEIKTVLERRT